MAVLQSCLGFEMQSRCPWESDFCPPVDSSCLWSGSLSAVLPLASYSRCLEPTTSPLYCAAIPHSAWLSIHHRFPNPRTLVHISIVDMILPVDLVSLCAPNLLYGTDCLVALDQAYPHFHQLETD